MVADEQRAVFWVKARENLAGAGSEFMNGRYNSCASRCYYAAFQAAIVALLDEGIGARTGSWGHRFVQAQFAGQLMARRKLFAGEFRDLLTTLLDLRHRAGYGVGLVSQREASRAVRRVETFVAAVASREGDQR